MQVGENDVRVASPHDAHDCNDSEMAQKSEDVPDHELEFCPSAPGLVPSVEPASYVEVVDQDVVGEHPFLDA